MFITVLLLCCLAAVLLYTHLHDVDTDDTDTSNINDKSTSGTDAEHYGSGEIFSSGISSSRISANDFSSDNISSDNSSRQTILSMGAAPGTIYISWKGSGLEPQYVQVSQSKEDIGRAELIEGTYEKTLNGRYYRYTVRIDGLEPGSTYYYQIGDGENFDSPQEFTVPEDDDGCTFLYLGDVQFDVSQAEYEDWGDMTEDIYSRNPQIQFAIIGGDMVNVTRREEQWNAFLENCGVFRSIPLMTVSGNHEGESSNRIYRKMFAVADNGPDDDELKGDFYYFDCGNCRFVMTDSSFLTDERMEELGEDRWEECEKKIEEWLRSTLASSDKTWKIVTAHHPPYGLHDNDTVSPQLRELWVPILEEEGTDLVLCGHQHTYMRTKEINGITYVMGNSGSMESEFYNGLNAPMYCMEVYAEGANYQIIEADSRQLKVSSYDKSGLRIDEVCIGKSSWLDFFRKVL